MKKITYVNLGFKNRSKTGLIKIFKKILDSGEFVGGKEIIKFEKNISKLCKTNYAVALNSGTDALTLALHLLGVNKGDEVITTPNSFIASTAAIVHLGAIPVFVDVLNDQNIDPMKIEKVITKTELQRNTLRIKVDEELSIDFINEVLFEYEFSRVDFVTQPGDFSVRGGIIDVFSFSNDKPYRIEFFGNEITRIRSFDLESQLSIQSFIKSLSKSKKKIVKEIKVKSNTPKNKFLNMVNKAKNYIKLGDIFQVVLSQRFEAKLTKEPLEIYKKLRITNPSPFMFFFNFSDFQIVGASPG